MIIGSDIEIFFNKESKEGTWEIVYDSSDDKVSLCYFSENDSDPSQTINMSKKEFLQLRRFLKHIRLQKNHK